jgi:hypothetical protein
MHRRFNLIGQDGGLPFGYQEEGLGLDGGHVVKAL